MNGSKRTVRARRWAGWALAAIVAIGAGWMIFAPEPVAVELAETVRGPLEVTVDQEGEVRVHDRYVIAAPVAGKLIRVALRAGDAVQPEQVVASLEPVPLDPRARQEALARVDAARALVREAQFQVTRAAALVAQRSRERERMEKLREERFVSAEAVDKARTDEAAAEAELDAARARAAAARQDERVAEAALLAMPAVDGRRGRLVELAAPVAGRVLRVLEESERTLAAGTPLMVIGDPSRFEIVADVLSTDAVKISPGAQARLEEWGGDRSLQARVRVVEPYAFTKISALGIEEQRVNVVLDPVDPLGPLGDGYRVEVRIVIWSAPDVLKVPASALFRRGDAWAVFVVEEGRARIRTVKVGQRNPFEAQVLDSLAAGARVVKYPGNQLEDGARVRPLARDQTS
ncbi:MAG: HlyD family efflux transporter periplasmic adaptor subunit [Burkholderiales bacterium]|nr:HlyD family efflux transporter periplasmic adaptor subunit [Burkholderiales bacterium]